MLHVVRYRQNRSVMSNVIGIYVERQLGKVPNSKIATCKTVQETSTLVVSKEEGNRFFSQIGF